MHDPFRALLDLLDELRQKDALAAERARQERRDLAWYWHQVGFCDRLWCPFCDECPGMERGGRKAPCCDRAGQHDGSAGGESLPSFYCPVGCPCHD